MRDGSYRLSLVVDRHIGVGNLTMFSRNGQGHDGLYQVEVFVSGTGHDLHGVVNLLLVAELAGAHEVPHHYSLAVTGSGDGNGFNLIGVGPRELIVEIDAQWRQALHPACARIGFD